MAFPLEGVRILDLTMFQQGTYATTLLADLGADVIKIEGPDDPDPGRGIGGIYANDTGLNPYFEMHNHSKRGIVLDLKDERGRAALYRLVPTAQAFVTNMRSPALKRLGADYESIRAQNPAIVYARGSGYGPYGPDRDAPSMDILGQARGGVMSVTGEPDDPPLPVGAPQADQVGAMMLAFGTMVALYHQKVTGEGQEVDSSLLGGQLCLQATRIAASLFSGRMPERNYRAGNVPTWNIYQGSDGKWFAIGMQNHRLWPRICEVLGRPEWATEEPYGPPRVRVQHFKELIGDLGAVFATMPAAHWVKAFTEADLMAAPVNDYGDLANDPQILANDYITEVERPDGQPPVRLVGAPVIFSKTPAKVRSLAPEFGQHTEELLLEAGYTWEELVELRAAGVIGARID
jgi:crotonobetainyl-CoA:carnitine CoA-transferase CaiB-like acyl-CoA transferase